MCSIMPGTPTHSKTTGPRGVAPAFSAARITCAHGSRGTARSLSIASRPSSASAIGLVRYRFDSSKELHGESAAGSITTSAPHCSASARRPGEKSLAITCRTPGRLEHQDHRQPDRAAADHDRGVLGAHLPASYGVQRDRHRLGQRGASAPSPSGTRIVIDAVTSTCSAYPPEACSLSPVRCTESPARRTGSATTRVPTGHDFLVRGPVVGHGPDELVPHDDPLVRPHERVVPQRSRRRPRSRRSGGARAGRTRRSRTARR